MCEAMRGELAADNIGVSAFLPRPRGHQYWRGGPVASGGVQKMTAGYAGNGGGNSQPVRIRRTRMSIEECGERVLRGIRRNDRYTFTHREFKEGVAERMEAILASFPQEDINQTRAQRDHVPDVQSRFHEKSSKPHRSIDAFRLLCLLT